MLCREGYHGDSDSLNNTNSIDGDLLNWGDDSNGVILIVGSLGCRMFMAKS